MFFLQADASDILDWNMLLFGENNWKFILEVMLRSFIMFCISLITLRLLGKRGVKQRLFEIVVIITLGSAAGDAMFYKDVGLVPAISVFAMIIIMYKLSSYLVVKSKWFDTVIEGQPVLLINDGAFNYEVYKKLLVSQDEFLADMRFKSISQMGQVKRAYLEDSGDLSIFYYTDEDVKYGMPIFPLTENSGSKEISEPGFYSCMHCGDTTKFTAIKNPECPVCKNDKWIKSSNEKRIT